MLQISSLSLPLLLAVFGGAAVVVWIAGVWLSRTTDVLDDHFHLGQALGGLILLAITTNLPEIAITVSAAMQHHLGIAIGNILGGIAMQTLVLVIFDIWGVGSPAALTYRAASLLLVLEGVTVMAVLVVVVMGSQFPPSFHFGRMTPASLLITAIWLIGLWMISKARKGLPWNESGEAPDNQKEQPPDAEAKQKEEQAKKIKPGPAAVIFLLAAAATLAAGVALEQSGDGIAKHFHITGVLFGATVLAAATSLPEVSTGLDAVKAGNYQLAFSDIFGGNAFLPVLFLVADVVSGQAVLPQARHTDIYLTGLGALLTSVYLYGLIFRPRRQILRMGIDSFVVLILYIFGALGLVALAR
jgi:cation:H+ antiporter